MKGYLSMVVLRIIGLLAVIGFIAIAILLG